MDTEEEAGAVSTLGSLASGGDTAVYSLGEINRPGSPFVGLGPSRRDSKRVQKGRSGGSGGPSSQPSSNLELSRLAARIGTVMGQFDRTLAATRDAQHLAFFELSEANQTHAAYLEAQARRLEKGEQIVGEELDTLKSALDQVTTQSTNMQAEVIARVGHVLQAHTAQQYRQAEVSTRLQAQDEELRDRVLALEKLLEKADAKYLEQQQAHRNELATVLDEMKRSREEIRELAQRQSAAPTVLVTDEGEGVSYRMRGALQPRVEEEEEDVWVQKRSDPTPPRGGNGGRIPPPPGGNGGDPDPSDHESDGEKRREIPKGKRQRRPTTPEDDDPQLEKLVKVLGMVLGGSKRKPADPPFVYKHLDYQDVKVWLLACEDYFARNPTYWMKEEDKIIYAIGRMEGKEVAPFALAYRKQITGELGFQKQEGYEYWHIFKAQVILRFTVFHEAERALRRMELAKYQGDIEKYLLELENLNIQAQVTGIAWRYMVEKRLPLEALRRLSNQEYGSDPEWLEAIRTVTKAEEAFKEQRGLRHEPSTKSDSSGKRKREKDSGEKTSRKRYSPSEKAVYKAKKAGEKTGKAAPEGQKVEHTNFKDAHAGIHEDEIDKRRKNDSCTRCGSPGHRWKNCRKPIQVSTIGRRKVDTRNSGKLRPKFQPRRPQVATVADRSQEKNSHQVNRIERPRAWDTDMDEA